MNNAFCSPERLSRSSGTAAEQVPGREENSWAETSQTPTGASFHTMEMKLSSQGGHQQGPGDFWFLAKEAKVSFNLEVNPPRAEIPSLRVDESLFLCTHTAGRTKPAIL